MKIIHEHYIHICKDAGLESDLFAIHIHLKGLTKLGEQIMSKIGDFLTQQQQYNDQISQKISALRGDIESLHSTISDLQANNGGLSDEDQAMLDQVQSSSQAVVDQITSVDDLTPPDTSNVPIDGTDTGTTGTNAGTDTGTTGTDGTTGGAATTSSLRRGLKK